MFRMGRQYRKKDCRGCHSTETAPKKGEKQLVGTEQRTVSQNGTVRFDDRGGRAVLPDMSDTGFVIDWDITNFISTYNS